MRCAIGLVCSAAGARPAETEAAGTAEPNTSSAAQGAETWRSASSSSTPAEETGAAGPPEGGGVLVVESVDSGWSENVDVDAYFSLCCDEEVGLPWMAGPGSTAFSASPAPETPISRIGEGLGGVSAPERPGRDTRGSAGMVTGGAGGLPEAEGGEEAIFLAFLDATSPRSARSGPFWSVKRLEIRLGQHGIDLHRGTERMWWWW